MSSEEQFYERLDQEENDHWCQLDSMGELPLQDPTVSCEANAPPQQSDRESTPREKTDLEPRMCRICFGGEGGDVEGTPEEDLGRLISPCKCKGSMKYVHLNCINEWRKVNPQSASYYECDQCHYKYHFEKTKIAHFLRNEAIITLLTLLTFAALIFIGGFLGKFLIISFLKEEAAAFADISVDDLDDDMDRFFHAFFTHPSLFSLFAFDYTHFLSGLLVVGFAGSISYVSFSSFGLRRFRRRTADDVSVGLLVVIVLIGTLRALWWVYKKVRSFAVKSLEMMEKRILDIDEEHVDEHVVQ